MPTLDNDPLAEDQPNPALKVLRRNAEWAGMFGNNSDPRQPVNLAQRARRAADRDAYAAAAVAEQARRDNIAIQTDKTRQSLYFKQQALNDRRAAAMDAMQTRHDLFELRRGALEAQTKASTALEAERLAKQTAIENKAAQDASNRTAVYDKWNALNADPSVKPGSFDYAKRTLDILMQHGDALDSVTKKGLLDTAKVTTPNDPEQAAEEAVAGWTAIHSKLPPNAMVTGQRLPSGKFGFSIRERPTPKISDPELETLKSNLANTLKDEGTETPRTRTLRERIAKRQQELGGVAAPAAAATIPAAPVAAPPTAPDSTVPAAPAITAPVVAAPAPNARPSLDDLLK